MYSPDAQCSKKSPHVQRIWKLLCIDYCKRLKRWLIDWTILLSWNKQFFPHQGQWIKNLINTYFFHKISQKKLVLNHKSSVVDPNTLNLDPDPGFRPNLDPDPEISWIRIQIRIRNTGWIWNGGLSKFASKTDPELKNSFVTVNTFNIVTFPILFQKFIFEVIHFENKQRCHETIYYKVLLPFYDEKWAMVKTVGNLDFHDNI